MHEIVNDHDPEAITWVKVYNDGEGLDAPHSVPVPTAHRAPLSHCTTAHTNTALPPTPCSAHCPLTAWHRGTVHPAQVQYLYAVYWALTTLTTVGYGDITPTNDVERVYSLFALLIGALGARHAAPPPQNPPKIRMAAQARLVRRAAAQPCSVAAQLCLCMLHSDTRPRAQRRAHACALPDACAQPARTLTCDARQLHVRGAVFGYMLSSIGSLVAAFDRQRVLSEERLDEVKDYIRWRKLPRELVVRLRRYCSPPRGPERCVGLTYSADPQTSMR
jgi:hypothetical protein